MRFVFCCFLTFIYVVATPAWGEERVGSFEELGRILSVGDEIQITDTGGQTLHGRLADLSPSLLRVHSRSDSHLLPANAVREIRRRHPDPWWNGALIGTGLGVATGLILTRAACGGNDPECGAIAGAAFVLPGIGIGAAVGALIDHSIKKFDTVYLAPAVPGKRSFILAPIISEKKKGIQLAIAF